MASVFFGIRLNFRVFYGIISTMKKQKTPYEQIKKQNGEVFARAIRDYDDGIFDVPDIVNIVKYAGRKAKTPLLQYLASLKIAEIEEQGPYEDPFVLLKKAGYDAFYADTLEKQNAIQKYFAVGEELCTFRDKTRFERFYIIHAVREGVEQLDRKDFEGKESRQDAYGTSVISIQILKEGRRISIKNRYNHAVTNCDSTFNNNPDNIYPGLSMSLKRHFNVDFSTPTVDVPEGFFLLDNQLIRYNSEHDDIHFGPDYYVRDAVFYKLNKSEEIMMDGYILNMKDRTLLSPVHKDLLISIDDAQAESDAFMTALSGELRNKKVYTTKNPDDSHNIMADDTLIATVKDGLLIKLNLPTTTSIGDCFLSYDQSIKEFNAPLLTEVGYNFLFYNDAIQHLKLENLRRTGADFMTKNDSLLSLDMPRLEWPGQFFLQQNKVLQLANIPQIKNVPDFFLGNNVHLRRLNMAGLENTGDGFLMDNEDLVLANFSNLKSVGDNFCCNNKEMLMCRLPRLQSVGRDFFTQNTKMEKVFAPHLAEIGESFLPHNFTYKINATALVGKIPPERICLLAKEYIDKPSQPSPLWASKYRTSDKGR